MPSARFEQRFGSADGEAVAVVHASCAGCDWGKTDREAAAVRISIDGEYSQHLLLARGAEDSDYRITLGHVTAGSSSSRRRAGSTPVLPSAGPAADLAGRRRGDVRRSDDARLAQSLAPFVYARPNTVGRFTDLPVLMWCEVVVTPRGRQFRYSVIFTNEDGGTATDRLMATWGRTTDIEYIYGAEVDSSGKVLAEEFQGPGHEVPAFRGRHEGGHPLMWVSTDNNMVSESGPTEIRYAPAPERVDLNDVSREEVMDRHPWSYTLAACGNGQGGKDRRGRGRRLGSHSGRAPLRSRRSVHGTGERGGHLLDSRQGVGRRDWHDADRGMPAFRIVRSACFEARSRCRRGRSRRRDSLTRLLTSVSSQLSGRD